MSLLRDMSSRLRRATASERMIRQCRAIWIQRGLSELDIEELCDDLEDNFAEAEEHGYDPGIVVDYDVLRYAEEMGEQHAPPKKLTATTYKTALIALVSICAVLVPQHVLLSSWTISVGWSEIAAVAAVFSAISLLQWREFSAVTYKGRQVHGIFFVGDVWAFTLGILIGMAFQVFSFEPAATQVLEWTWWASLLTIGLALLVSRLHRLSTAGPVSPQVCAEREQEGPARGAKATLWLALIAFSCNLFSWLTADGLSKEWSTLMLIASTLLLALVLSASGKRDRRPSAF